MITIKPKRGHLLTYRAIKEWVDSMDEHQLAQVAFVYRDDFTAQDGCIKNESAIVGTTEKNAHGFALPRLICSTYKP